MSETANALPPARHAALLLQLNEQWQRRYIAAVEKEHGKKYADEVRQAYRQMMNRGSGHER